MGLFLLIDRKLLIKFVSLPSGTIYRQLRSPTTLFGIIVATTTGDQSILGCDMWCGVGHGSRWWVISYQLLWNRH